MLSDRSIREWLDEEVKAGYGAKFASAFEEVGIEDKSDLHHSDEAIVLELEGELRDAGAKSLHLKLIKEAIEVIIAPMAETRAKLTSAKISNEYLESQAEKNATVLALRDQHRTSTKKFAAFLTHHKVACAMEARFIKSELERLLGGADVFLDSDDLKDLRQLGSHVTNSAVLVLLQSAEVLLRPWCVFELCTAIDANVPIVAVTVEGKGYDFADAGQLLLHLDTALEERNPGASEVLSSAGIDLVEAAWKLSTTIPNVISVHFNPSGSQNNIAASILDLVEAIYGANARPIDTPFEQWAAHRGSQPVSTRQHGSGAATDDQQQQNRKSQPLGVERPRSRASRRLSGAAGNVSLPSTVPDLPRGYLVRETILAGIQKLLFPPANDDRDHPSENNPDCSSNACNLASPPLRTVVVRGMGGSGKTVTATALLFDLSIRSQFDAVVFLPFGQDPLLKELQKTMHLQLTGKILDVSLDAEEILAALQSAARGRKVLCVLDDIWTKEAFHPFCRLLDDGTASRLLVTTRIHSLVSGASEFELGLLSPDDSVRLLLECCNANPGHASFASSSSSSSSESPQEFAPELYEVVRLCGHLPLVISIAAGILEQQYGGVVEESYLALLSADTGEVLREGDGQGYGAGINKGGEGSDSTIVSLEDRLITASLASYTGRDKEQVEALFLRFAVWPEDTPVPVAVFDAIAPLWAGQDVKRPHLKVRSWLTALLRCSLVVGSLAAGLYQHDIVRQFVLSRHSDADLIAMQRQVVAELLAARPARGFPEAGASSEGSLEAYVARSLWWHLRYVLSAAPPDRQLVDHQDRVVLEAVALAMGSERLADTSRAWEAAGDTLGAAKLSWIGRLLITHRAISTAQEFDFVFRAADLLRRIASDDTVAFETEVLTKAFVCDMGSDRHGIACARLKELTASQPATFDSKVGEAAALWNAKIGPPWGFFGPMIPEFKARSLPPNPSLAHMAEVLEGALQYNQLYVEAAALTDNPMHRHYLTLGRLSALDFHSPMSHSDRWPVEAADEKALVEAVEAYDYHADGPVHKAIGMKIDVFRGGMFLHMLALHFGALHTVRTWCRKTTTAFAELNLAVSHSYSAQVVEVQWLQDSALHVLLLLGDRTALAELLAAMGFAWDDSGFEAYWSSFHVFLGAAGTFPRAMRHTMLRLFLYLASEDGALDPAEVRTWIPSPEVLDTLDRESWACRAFALNNVLALGARAHERLGQLQEAAAAARLGIAQGHKPTVVADCHCVLGRVLANDGDDAGAAEHFRTAIGEAHAARTYMLEVIAALEWRRCCCRDGADHAEVDAVIDAACANMRKKRADVEAQLVDFSLEKSSSSAGHDRNHDSRTKAEPMAAAGAGAGGGGGGGGEGGNKKEKEARSPEPAG